MLRIPAPTAQDRALQWSDAYDAAETLFTKAFKNCPQLICTVSEASLSLNLVCEAIEVRQAIPFQIAAAAALTAAQDLHEQYHNPV